MGVHPALRVVLDIDPHAGTWRHSGTGVLGLGWAAACWLVSLGVYLFVPAGYFFPDLVFEYYFLESFHLLESFNTQQEPKPTPTYPTYKTAARGRVGVAGLPRPTAGFNAPLRGSHVGQGTK